MTLHDKFTKAKASSINEDSIEVRKMAFECGALEDNEVQRLIQDLINDGTIWTMSNEYIRYANALLLAGECRRYA